MNRKTHEAWRSFKGAMMLLAALILVMSISDRTENGWQLQHQSTEIACE